MRVDLDAPDVTPVLALVAKLAPKTAQALARGAAAMAPARLHAQFTLDGAAPATLARLTIGGSLGAVRVALNGEAKADAIALRAGDLRLDGTLEADDGKALVAMLGLDRYVAVAAGPGALTFKSSGPARGQWRIDGKLAAGGFDASANGTASSFADSPAAALRATIARADLAPLRGGTRAALPMTFAGNVAIDGEGRDAERHRRHVRRRLAARQTRAHAGRAASPARRHRRRWHRRAPVSIGGGHRPAACGRSSRRARPGPGRASRLPAACSAIMPARSRSRRGAPICCRN